MIKYYDLKLIEYNDNHYLYYVPKGQLFSVEDRRLFSLCEKIQNGHIVNLESKNYQKLQKIVNNSSKPIFRESYPGYKNITINLAGECNLRCPYCFARDKNNFHFGNFSEEQANKVIDFCVMNDPDRKVYSICYFGGEPLLNFNVLKRNVEYMKMQYPSKKFIFSITTNGTIAYTEILEFLKDNRFLLLVSYDGLNNRRPFANGNASTNIVLENIQRMKKVGIDVTLRPTIMSNSNEIYDNIKYMESLQINFEFAFVFSTSHGETNISDYSGKARANACSQFDKIVQYYTEKITNRERIYCQTIINNVCDINFKFLSNYACSAGLCSYTFNNNGDIYTCQNNASNQDLSCGNIESGLDNKKVRRTSVPSVKSMSRCKKCWVRYICSGGCSSEKISLGLTSKSIIEDKCEFEKMQIESMMHLICNIYEKCPEFFDYHFKKLKERYAL